MCLNVECTDCLCRRVERLCLQRHGCKPQGCAAQALAREVLPQNNNAGIKRAARYGDGAPKDVLERFLDTVRELVGLGFFVVLDNQLQQDTEAQARVGPDPLCAPLPGCSARTTRRELCAGLLLGSLLAAARPRGACTALAAQALCCRSCAGCARCLTSGGGQQAAAGRAGAHGSGEQLDQGWLISTLTRWLHAS